MYHRDSCETAEDAINDLVDYCYRKLCYLISRFGHVSSPVGSLDYPSHGSSEMAGPTFGLCSGHSICSVVRNSLFWGLVKVNQV